MSMKREQIANYILTNDYVSEKKCFKNPFGGAFGWIKSIFKLNLEVSWCLVFL